jgi:hypothetical protein
LILLFLFISFSWKMCNKELKATQKPSTLGGPLEDSR